VTTPQYPPSAGWEQPVAGYAHPGYGPSAKPGTSGLAIAALITGLAFWCFLIPGIVAIVLGNLALEQIEDSNGLKTGRGLAIAGIILGWVGVGIVALSLIGWIISLATST
jgi:hypothetical protein